MPVVEVDSDSVAPSADRLDVLIEGRGTDGSKWCVAIEAKVDSQEGKDQLARYDKWLTPNFSEHTLLKLYLTVEPEANSGSATTPWVNIFWGEHVANALDQSKAELTQAGPILDRRVAEFIKDYRQLVSGLSNDETNALDHRIHAFANRTDVSAVLRTLKQRIDAKQIVRRWDSESWVRTYWQHRALLDICKSHVRSTEAEFMWEHVLNEIVNNDAWHVLTPITAKTSRVTFVPTSWLGPGTECLRNKQNGWNLHYLADFRKTNEHKDVEVKLYFPETGDRTTQKAILAKLFLNDENTASASDCFSPDLGRLRNFMDGPGQSLKIHSVSAHWEQLPDGSFQPVAWPDAKREAKYRNFWTNAKEQIQAILKLAQTHA
jgi:hypothetical protein